MGGKWHLSSQSNSAIEMYCLLQDLLAPLLHDPPSKNLRFAQKPDTTQWRKQMINKSA
jgi:hypothetical protein